MEQKSAVDGRTIVAIFVCLGIWWGWQSYLQKKYPEAMSRKNETTQATSTQTPQETPAKLEKADTPTPVIVKKPMRSFKEERQIVERDNLKVVFSNMGGRVISAELKNFTDTKNQQVSIGISNEQHGGGLLFIEGYKPEEFYNLPYELESKKDNQIIYRTFFDGGTIRRTYDVLQNNVIRGKVEISGLQAKATKIVLDFADPVPHKQESSSFAASFFGVLPEVHEYFFKHASSKIKREQITHEQGFDGSLEQVHLAAIGARYFTTLFINQSSVLPDARAKRDGDLSVLQLGFSVLDKNSKQEYSYDLFVGPKSLDLLRSVNDGAKDILDFGMFSFIARPLLSVMKWFFDISKNWGVAIILLTILVRVLTFPFMYMSYKSMKGMQKIQPEMKRLQEIYKDDKQKMNLEVMKLMRENKVNPMSGCLPMLLQLPIFFALYQVLQNSIELYHSPFFGWIHDLTQKDPFYVLPILMGVSMFMQQKMTPNTMDPAQARVLLFMPIFFTFLMLGLPSGLTLYIFVSTLFGIIQQMIMMKEGTSTNQVVVRRA